MQVVLNVKGSFRTTESGHSREVVALYRWPLVQVPLYFNEGFQKISVCNFRTQFSGENFYARGRALFEARCRCSWVVS